MIRLARPMLGDEEAKAVADVLESGWLVQGKKVEEFEGLLSQATGALHVAACSSGTAALQLAIDALNLPGGARVAVPAYTFPATINAVLLAGLQPVPVDIDPSTYNLEPNDTWEVMTGRGAAQALLAVHQFGLPAPLDLLQDLGKPIIEDAACALGSSLRFPGQEMAVLAGSMGELAAFSFHPRKVITTGEGGAVTTSNPEHDARIRERRNHGQRVLAGGPMFCSAGWNFRLSEIHATIGVVQMDRLSFILEDRQRIAAGYNERLESLAELGVEPPRVPPGAQPNWQSYVIRLPQGADLASVVGQVRWREVEVNYGARALHREPAYMNLPGFDRPLPGADDAADRAVALPVATGLTDEELDRVIDTLRQVLEKG